MEPFFSPEHIGERLAQSQADVGLQSRRLLFTAGRHLQHIGREHGERLNALWTRAAQIAHRLEATTGENRFFEEATIYYTDASRRGALFLDALRQRADNDKAHEAAGTPPVLKYDYEPILEGRDLARPCNYRLLKITPPPGVEVFDWKRPYMIIDPRAGHGAGIGGFKEDSQVGVALHDGHPVYFCVFHPHPEPGQTLADVMRAEAEFVREIARRHPQSPKPIVVGNCQGGWATMVLAANCPDIAGPLLINGAPLSTWSGRLGENPMRYNGGMLGGALPALLLADLGHGEFDGAWLVANFEALNPARNYFGKYYDLFADPVGGRARFLEFERWWGGIHFMNEAEIRWIVEQLFIGNRLARGAAQIEPGRGVDFRAIRSPIVVFASFGDNITPPQQALNWIVDTYADEHEIKIRGQRIIYMVHDKVGHLGIFVSSSIARKEHTEVTSTVKTIEALAPGLYEMKVEEEVGEGVHKRFSVSFAERKIADILALDENDRSEEADFAAVARLSELAANAYTLALRPLVQSGVTKELARTWRELHPLRAQRRIFGSINPFMQSLAPIAAAMQKAPQPIGDDNPFELAERLWADSVTQTLDFWRDLRDAVFEVSFLSIYGNPFMHWIGAPNAFKRALAKPEELRFLPRVQAALRNLERGGFAEGVIRIMLLLSEARGAVRRDRLERSAHMLSHDQPFVALGAARRGEMIEEQSIIVQFEPQRALESLPSLLKTPQERTDAVGAVEFVAGAIEEMEPRTLHMLQEVRKTLDLPPIAANIAAQDPLTSETVAFAEA